VSYTTIAHYQAELTSGKTTVQQTVADFLVKIEANRHLNAYLEVFGEEATQRLWH
jgi:aspartyl-tRNA(Asn)/glutamyl-tRNA(Gln) amidotransferase subunit A